MKNLIIKTLLVLFMLAVMAVGFVFVGAFAEYKTVNGANIYTGLTFAIVLCSVLSVATFMTIKEVVLINLN